MSRRQRTSKILEKVKFRVAGLKAIDPNIRFDDNYNLQNLTQLMDQVENILNNYNDAIAVIDSSKKKLDEMEKTLSNLSDKMLVGVGFRYGKNSDEYELAGGVRDSERVRKGRLTRLKNSAEKTTDENTITS